LLGDERNAMRYWLDYDFVAVAVLMLGIGIIELLVFGI
jgi:hypothetical protein